MPPPLKRLRRLLYWLLPVIILAVVFSRIDFAALGRTARQADTFLALAALFSFPMFMVLGGLRWNRATSRYCNRAIPLSFSVQHYWAGLALGIFVPGSVGWDAYRVIVAGRRYGHYAMNAAVILVEKMLALLACATLVSLAYPFVTLSTDVPLLRELIDWSHILLLGMIGLLFLVIYFSRLEFSRALAGKAESYMLNLVSRVLGRPAAEAGAQPGYSYFHAAMAPLHRPRFLLELLVLSIAILSLSALINQLLFRAVGHELPFVVNLLLAPMFFLIFVLPISVGGVGVREASYITLYGLFGVPVETALLVSFLVFAGDIFNSLIGALLLYVDRNKGTSELNRALSSDRPDSS